MEMGMSQRGRPKIEGELKESSVRIRPALKAKLEQAATESGQSIARELEERLEAAFTDIPMRGPTIALTNRIARTVKEIERETGKQWDKDLTAWAMLREELANGPVTDFLPHPDEAVARNAIAANTEKLELQAEKRGITNLLRKLGLGIEPDPAPILGGATLGIPQPTRDDARRQVEEIEGLPPKMRETLLAQLTRLDELDAQIANLEKQVNDATAPYWRARHEARERLYRKRGRPDLITWLMAPHGFDEAPPRQASPPA
jgi:hypothetical protein